MFYRVFIIRCSETTLLPKMYASESAANICARMAIKIKHRTDFPPKKEITNDGKIILNYTKTLRAEIHPFTIENPNKILRWLFECHDEGLARIAFIQQEYPGTRVRVEFSTNLSKRKAIERKLTELGCMVGRSHIDKFYDVGIKEPISDDGTY